MLTPMHEKEEQVKELEQGVALCIIGMVGMLAVLLGVNIGNLIFLKGFK